MSAEAIKGRPQEPQIPTVRKPSDMLTLEQKAGLRRTLQGVHNTLRSGANEASRIPLS